MQAGETYGYPARRRSDFGGENVGDTHFMIMLRGTACGSHITGRSIHNQRIERLWHDEVFAGCLGFYHVFYFFENSNILCVYNPVHLQALHYVYNPRISAALTTFREAWNHPPLRMAGNWSPTQMWVAGMLDNFDRIHLPVQDTFFQDTLADCDSMIQISYHKSPSQI